MAKGAADMMLTDDTFAPIMNRPFHTAPLSGEAWLHILAVAPAGYAVVGLEKWIRCLSRWRGVSFPRSGCSPNPSLPGNPTPIRYAHEGEGRPWQARHNNPRLGRTANAVLMPSPSLHFA